MTPQQIQSRFEREKQKRDDQNAIINPIVEARVEAEVEKRAEAMDVSEARKKVKALLGEFAPSRIQSRIVGDVEWFIRRVDNEALTRIGMMSARDQRGRLSMTEAGQLTGLVAAMFWVCLCEDEEGAPLFEEWEEAYNLAAHTSGPAIEMVDGLFRAILAINPEILPSQRPRPESKDEVAGDFLGSSAQAGTSSIL